MTQWIDHALCAQVGTDLFFPEAGSSVIPAKRVCAKCTVRTECLESALAEEEDGGHLYGVRGGMSPRQRRDLMRASAA